MKENKMNVDFEKHIAKSSALFYTAPICLIVIFLHLINIHSSYILEVILIYLIGTISHSLAWGFTAVNSQIVLSTSNKSKS
jgi:uncharacterized membrane protein